VTIGVVTLSVSLLSSVVLCPEAYIGFILQYVVDVAAIFVATLGFGFPSTCPMASRGSSSLNMASFAGVAIIAVPTFGVSLSQSLRVASRDFCWRHLRFRVGVTTLLPYVIPTLIYAKYGVLFSFWSRGIRMPSLVQVGLSVLEL
jgi:hypothetical protein